MITKLQLVVYLFLLINIFAAKGHQKVNSEKGKRKRQRIHQRQLEVTNGGWSSWTLRSFCNYEDCTEIWNRFCNNPRPANGGLECEGESYERRPCRDSTNCRSLVTQSPTEEYSSTSFYLQNWSRWGPCSVSCGIGRRKRFLLPCLGVCEKQEQRCVKPPCASPVGMGEWGEWAECINCTSTRSRKCAQPDICGDKMETETRQCDDCHMDSEASSACEMEQNILLMFGRKNYELQCLAGKYAGRQCDSSLGICWCVNVDTGYHILGTLHPYGETSVHNCDKLSKMSMCHARVATAKATFATNSNTEIYKPQCLPNGDFNPQQVNDELGIQWCVYKDGFEIKNTRKSINSTLSCDLELNKLTKCEDSKTGTCNKHGLYDKTQCTYSSDGKWKLCECVYANGQPKDDTLTTGDPKCGVYSDLTLTKCQAAAIKWNVECLPSGEYGVEHCQQGVCFCIRPDGSVIDGTEKLIYGERSTSCEELIRKDEEMNMIDDVTTPSVAIPSEAFSTSPSKGTSVYPPSTPDYTYPSNFSDLPSLSTITYSTQLGELTEFKEYGEWSDWTDCSVECGGGHKYATRQCPEPNGACGGPDIGQRWMECNTFNCVEVTIERLDYVWMDDDSTVEVVCLAAGLPEPLVVLRDGQGDNLLSEPFSDGTTRGVKLTLEPRDPRDRNITCVATGEGQIRRTITISGIQGVISNFTITKEVAYKGQSVDLYCYGTGKPKPTIVLYQDGTELKKGVGFLKESVKVTKSFVFSCQIDGSDSPPEIQTVFVIDPCEGVNCSSHASCVVNEKFNGRCICDACDHDDLDTNTMVCGSNCRTYLSMCHLNRDSCLQGGEPISVIRNDTCDSIVKPTITNECPLKSFYEGSSLSLICDAKNADESQITWIRQSTGETVKTGRFLSLIGLTTADTDDYVCVVKTCGGEASLICPVIVKEKNMEECTQYGAGHFHQFDGTSFTYPGVCHYALAMDCSYGQFYIYTGTSQCGSATMPLAYASSITVFVRREAVVLLRGFEVNEFGVMRHVYDGEEMHYQNFRIWRESELLYVTHKDTNFTLSWDGLTTATVSMSKEYRGRLCGLCGDVGLETQNEIEDVEDHGSMYEIDRYDQCNVAETPDNTCTSEVEYRAAEQKCRSNLFTSVLSKCHDTVPVEEFVRSCIFDTCGVRWYKIYNTGLCNVLAAYAHFCQNKGIDVTNWRKDTICPFSLMQRVAYLSQKKRRRKRAAGFTDIDIMRTGD